MSTQKQNSDVTLSREDKLSNFSKLRFPDDSLEAKRQGYSSLLPDTYTVCIPENTDEMTGAFFNGKEKVHYIQVGLKSKDGAIHYTAWNALNRQSLTEGEWAKAQNDTYYWRGKYFGETTEGFNSFIKKFGDKDIVVEREEVPQIDFKSELKPYKILKEPADGTTAKDFLGEENIVSKSIIKWKAI